MDRAYHVRGNLKKKFSYRQCACCDQITSFWTVLSEICPPTEYDILTWGCKTRHKIEVNDASPTTLHKKKPEKSILLSNNALYICTRESQMKTLNL
jgi:hypothetical protein